VLTKSIATLVLLLLALFLLARWQERHAIFFPTREFLGEPSRFGLEYEDVYFNAGPGVKLHGWYVKGSTDTTVLWLHGNAGNISDRVEILVSMTRNLGVSSLLFDFRGYGRSTGKPSEKGLYADAEAAFDWLVKEKKTDPGSVIAYGHSLGSAVAVDLAVREKGKLGGMVLESPFTSAKEVARMMYGGLPVDLLMTMKLDNIGRINQTDTPLLIIHGDNDEVIPFSMGQKLYESAPEPKSFLKVPGAYHSDNYAVGGEIYWNAWKEFLSSIGGYQ